MFSKASKEDEDRIVEKLARSIVKFGMEVPATFLLETFRPVSIVTMGIAEVIMFPVLLLAGEPSFKFMRVMEEPKNVERVLKRIEELVEESKREGEGAK